MARLHPCIAAAAVIVIAASTVTAAAFSPDGKTLATASNDCTIVLWDVEGLRSQTKDVPAVAQADLDKLWSDLISDDAAKAFRAMGQMAEAPAQTPAFIKERLKPVPLPDAKRIESLVEDLDSAQYATRQKASAELEKLGDLAGPALRKKLERNPSLEVAKRVEVLLEKLDGPVTNGEVLRAIRAVEVLEGIGTEDALKVLEIVSGGAPGHRITEAAKDSAGRLKKRGR